MREYIKSNRLSFKIGSFEWMNFFGVPIGLIFIGLIILIPFIGDRLFNDSMNKLIAFALLVSSGLFIYVIQLKKLDFQEFELTRDLDDFKSDVRKILKKNNWDIEYDNQLFIQATQRGSVLNLDMLTLRLGKKEIKWNLIHHPQSSNSIAALFSLNRYGKRLIKEIKASA